MQEQNSKKIKKLELSKSYASKGITLIALVVTIVVLLILAGITINLIFNNNGIIQKAQEAVDITNKAVQNEKDELEALDSFIKEKISDEDEESWTLAEKDSSSPFYPGNYFNRCFYKEKKVYDESVKGIKVVIKDCQLERGEYDYLLFKNRVGQVLRIFDANTGVIYIEGNCLEYYFFSDDSVTRRGYQLDVYTTKDEKNVSIEEGDYVFNNEYRLCDIHTKTEQQTIHLEHEKTPKISIKTGIYTKSEQGWSITNDNDVSVNALVTITNIEGEVLYSKEIHDRTELVPEIINCPDEIIVTLDRRRNRYNNRAYSHNSKL